MFYNWADSYTTVNILKTTDLYTSHGWTVWYGNWASIKLLPKLIITRSFLFTSKSGILQNIVFILELSITNLESVCILLIAHSFHLNFPSFNTMHYPFSTVCSLFSFNLYQLPTQKSHHGKIPTASLLPKPTDIFCTFSDLSTVYANPESPPPSQPGL